MIANGKMLYAAVLTGLCLLVTSCRSSPVTVLDADSGKPIVDALVFAYSHEFVALPRQRVYLTDADGQTRVRVPGLASLWAGKDGYYPQYCGTKSGNLFAARSLPSAIRLHKVVNGNYLEARKMKNHSGAIFYYRNPPREEDLLKILKYSHWVYLNSCFYYGISERAVLEEFFQKYGFPLEKESDFKRKYRDTEVYWHRYQDREP